VPIVLKFWSLNLQETSGPVQACNGCALPFFTVFPMNYLHFLPRINLKILKLLELESRKAKRLLYNHTSPKWPVWGIRAANYLRRQLILLFLSGRANVASELRD
jgi:hypothetical protein